ncbi:MAG: efflux RND transporter periplasmic adaptor subunit [Bryobacterales bacterium]|nr:efflux RND transporter periplasmic adaptor subunit [Bryobacterales bacterium]
MKRLFWFLPLLGIGALAWYAYLLRNAPPEVPFTKVQRETLISSVLTNGKVEPVEWTALRAEREGAVERVSIEKGGTVAKGAVLAELDAEEAKVDLTAAQARVASAKAELDQLDNGGRARDIIELNSSLEKDRIDLAEAKRDFETLRRLVAKNAATRYEFDQARQKIQLLEAGIQSLIERREALVSKQDKAAARARLDEAQTAVESARRRIELSYIRAPIAGTVYQLEIRVGAYLRPGDLVAQIGQLDRVRVAVYVDEPDLGHIRLGLPVTITWEALPGRKWTGTVEKLPAEIVALGSRQVGMVACIIANEERLLLPNTNVNAQIRTNVVNGAITIPKEALRRQNAQPGVFLLEGGNRVIWRSVRIGASNITKVQVTEGLKEQDRVALPTDLALRDGLVVKPLFPAP